jgi:hypothetical protein
MALGISYIYLLGAFLPWHLLAYVCCAVPFVTVVGVMFAPESPVWLKANGRLGEAERAANWLKGEDSAK